MISNIVCLKQNHFFLSFLHHINDCDLTVSKSTIHLIFKNLSGIMHILSQREIFKENKFSYLRIFNKKSQTNWLYLHCRIILYYFKSEVNEL